MNAIKNYYFILGVSRGASNTEIEAAYESRKAVAAYDEFQASMMGEVTDAYEHLSDPARRREYDDTLGAPPQLSPTSGNIHNFRSAESGISLEIALSKARRKQQFRRQLVRDIIMAVIFLGVAGAGIHYGVKFFAKEPPAAMVSADLFRVTKPQPVPEPVIPPAAITAVKTAATPEVRSYSIQSGGVVTTDKAPCRAQPSSGARATTMMRKDTVIFATKEMRDKNGGVWYYVTNSQFEGWASGSDVRVFKY